MLLIYAAALFGSFRFRGIQYWKWIGILFVWMLTANLLFAAGGTKENPSGDGLITHQVRVATNDGPLVALFGLAFLIGYWGGAIWILRKLYIVGTGIEQAALEREWDSGEKVSLVRKLCEAAAFTLVAAAYVYFFFFAPLQNSMLPPPAPIATKAASDPIALELTQTVNELNRETPTKIDPITTLIRYSSKDRVLTYHYEIARRDGTSEQLRSYIVKNAIPAACKNPDMFRNMRDYEITYRYSYIMPNTTRPLEVDATYRECDKLN